MELFPFLLYLLWIYYSYGVVSKNFYFLLLRSYGALFVIVFIFYGHIAYTKQGLMNLFFTKAPSGHYINRTFYKMFVSSVGAAYLFIKFKQIFFLECYLKFL